MCLNDISVCLAYFYSIVEFSRILLREEHLTPSYSSAGTQFSKQIRTGSEHQDLEPVEDESGSGGLYENAGDEGPV